MNLLLNLQILVSICCSSCSAHQKPSTFPSSTCIDLLRVINVRYIVQQQHVLLSHSSSSVADLFWQDQTYQHCLSITMLNTPKVVMTEMSFKRYSSLTWEEKKSKYSNISLTLFTKCIYYSIILYIYMTTWARNINLSVNTLSYLVMYACYLEFASCFCTRILCWI